ncbi:methyltransferase [Bifidobacterium castoris]|uniref:Methyltransferase n=2 Tax=Bifidobacterium castoris TaxID=2306972 RepID=A0A430F9R0_9BIFI|nr:methyltransferase [Bifidobacterium castoris]
MMDKRTYDNHAKAWVCIEDHESAREPRIVRDARKLAQQAELAPCPASEGFLLNAFAQMTKATSAIVVGTGSLVETAQLVEGLAGAGKLTAVDSSAAGVAAIRAFFSGIDDTTRTTLRAVNATPSVFLQRLNGNDYDLIVVAGDASNYMPVFDQAPRLLRRGGAVVFTDALATRAPHAKGGLTNPADRGEKAVLMRALLERIEDDERFVSAMTPTGDGVLIAVLR